MTTIILGSQWGDEGKGKLTDILGAEAQICARASVSACDVVMTHCARVVSCMVIREVLANC